MMFLKYMVSKKS